MLRWHERTRRRVCRTLFVALCAAPTAATTLWVLSWQLPWRRHQSEAAWSRQLRGVVTLQQWRTPRPNVQQFTGAATLPGAAAPMCSFAEVEDRPLHDGRQWTVAAATLDAGQLVAWSRRCAEVAADLPPGTHELRCPRLTLTLPESSAAAPSADLQVRLEVRKESAGARRIELRGLLRQPADDDAPLRFTCAATLAPGQQPQWKTTVEARRPTPVGWLAAAIPGFGAVGPQARFVGRWTGTLSTESEATGQFRGRIEKVDLAAMLPDGSPHRLRGTADLEVDELSWHGEKIDRLAGRFAAASPEASRSLLAAAQKHLLCQLQEAESADGGATKLLPMEQAAAAFVLDQTGLSLWGDCRDARGERTDCLVRQSGRPLLRQPKYVLPAGAWVQFVAGPAASWLPATQEAVAVARLLPLPAQAAPR